MKIALYYPWIHLKSGVERTILETIKRSRHKYTIFTNYYDQRGTYPEFKGLKIVKLNKVPVRRNIFSTLRAAVIIALQKVDLSEFDLLLIHSEGLGDLFLFRNASTPAVCFCHTPLRPIFDREYKRLAIAKRGPIRRIAYIIFDLIFRHVDKVLWQKYDYVFFNSKETFNRAKAGRLIRKSLKYSILHPGVDWENVKPTWVYKKYFLAPGRITWTKNIELAIESFKEFCVKNNHNDFKLIIAGQVDDKSSQYFIKMKNLTRGFKNISFVINPDDAKMKDLYKNCYATVVTSFNEDWGITAVEANAFGKPVLAIDRGGFKESQINGITGYLVEPGTKPLAIAMEKLAHNGKLAVKLGKNGHSRAVIFDWGNFAKKHDAILDKING